MARGDMIVFDQFAEDCGLKLHNLNTDTINYAIIDNTTSIVTTLADPRWGAGGTTNLSSNQVATNAGYTGPVDTTNTFGDGASSDIKKLDCPNITVTGNASSTATDCYWMVFYNDTDAGKRCICAIDLGGPVSVADGDINVTIDSAGILQFQRVASA